MSIFDIYSIIERNSIVLLFILGALLVALLVQHALRVKFAPSKHLTESEYKLLSRLTGLYVLLGMIAALANFRFEFQLLFVAPLLLGLAAIPVIVGLMIYSKLHRDGLLSDAFLGKDVESGLRTLIADILDSGQFLTALRSTLPKGSDDHQHGLDYIPFMLHALDERRRRFHRLSNRFLTATLITGCVFVATVVSLGYLLLDEQAVGLPRTVAHLDTVSTQLSNDIRLLAVPVLESAVYVTQCRWQIELLKASASGSAGEQPRPQFLAAVFSAEQEGKLDELTRALADAMEGATDVGVGMDQAFLESLTGARTCLATLEGSRDAALRDVPSATERLQEVIADIEVELQQPQNRVAEVLKRLILSMVVVGFLLSILRFLSGLYKSHNRQMVRTEMLEFFVRKFYVAYKGSVEGSEARSLALKALLTELPGDEPDVGTVASDETLSIVKELLGVLSKKL